MALLFSDRADLPEELNASIIDDLPVSVLEEEDDENLPMATNVMLLHEAEIGEEHNPTTNEESKEEQDTSPPAPAPTPFPTPPPEEKTSSLINLDTRIELAELEREVRQIEEMEEHSPSPSTKRDNIKKLEKEVSLTEEKFEREMKILQEKEQKALLSCDVAGEADKFDKAGEHENDKKQYQERQAVLAKEHKITIDELKQKINDEKKQLERGSEGLARIQLKKEEYENRKKELKVGKEDGWIQEGRSLAEAVKVSNGLMERMNNLKSVKEKVAREKKVREERLRQVAVETSRREAEAARKPPIPPKVKKENKEKKQKADREQADREKARFRKRKNYLI